MIQSRQPDRRLLTSVSPATVILVCVTGLVLLGLAILFSASATYHEDSLFYLKRQIVWLGVAGVAGFAAAFINIEKLRRHAWLAAGVAVFVLVLVLIPGIGVKVNGSRRWLDFGPMRVQPSEFAKLVMVFALAHYLCLNQRWLGELKRGFVIPLAGVGLFAGLMLLEPDFGTAALTGAVGFCMLYLAGTRLRCLWPTVAGALLLFAVAISLNPVRLGRITAFLDVEGNRSDGAYQLWQAILAFAAGGAGGVGLGNGRQQMSFLPEAHTDCIFAVVGEELGLGFTLGVVAVFAIIFIAGLAHLRRAPNLFQYLLVAGCLLLMCMQAIINLGVVTGCLPTKGMSLPFISYGGSNLVLMAFIVGLIFNTRRRWGQPALDQGSRCNLEVVA